MTFDRSKLSLFPAQPGVYMMKGKGGQILYIGKGKNLKNRVKQYFVNGGDGRWIVPILQEIVIEIETFVTGTEKEALLLECNLIKKHKPRFNALLKDDKTYTALKINIRHPWPMLSLIRYKGKLKKDAAYFGPYTSAYAARQTLDLLQRVFPLRQCTDQELLRRTRPCILYGMKRCCAPCVGLVTKEKYDEYVDSAAKFLSGKSDEVLVNLKKEMQEASDQLEFERAGQILGLIHSIEKTIQVQKVDKPIGGFSGDVLGIFRQGDEVILSQMMFQEGRLHAFDHHNFSKIGETDEELIESFAVQHYLGAATIPKEVLIPVQLENQVALEEVIGPPINFLNPQRGEKKALLELARVNAQAAFQQKKDESAIREGILLEMQEKLRLERYPEKIECIDTSHLSGGEMVSSLVAFVDGKPDKSRYRRYKIRTAQTSDDYGALREVLMRRLEKGDFPDLLIIDGGKGHLNVALKTLHDLNIITIDVIGVAKEEGRHDKGATNEQVYLPLHKDPLFLPVHSPILFLLQRIRDEAHRFAITYQKKQRSKKQVRSKLLEVPGIGPAKFKALLRHFGSVQKIKEASEEELLRVSGISRANVAALKLMK